MSGEKRVWNFSLDDFGQFEVWVSPDGERLIPLSDDDEEYYPAYHVKCRLCMRDGTELPAVAIVNTLAIVDALDSKVFCIVIGDCHISFDPIFRTNAEMRRIEGALGKREEEIFPLTITAHVKLLDLDISQIEAYPYVRR
jgi:hypothetical protein